MAYIVCMCVFHFLKMFVSDCKKAYYKMFRKYRYKLVNKTKNKSSPRESLIRYSHFGTLLLLFSRSVVSDSLWPGELQHARLPCP